MPHQGVKLLTIVASELEQHLPKPQLDHLSDLLTDFLTAGKRD